MFKPYTLHSPTLLTGVLLAGLGAGCGGADETGMTLTGTDMGGPVDLTPPVPQIKHVVLIVQENHTFDTYFGRYCTAPSGANPTCTTSKIQYNSPLRS